MKPMRSASILAALSLLIPSLVLADSKSSLEELAARAPLTAQDFPWFILHGMLMFGKDLELVDSQTGRRVSALQTLLTQRTLTLPSGQGITTLREVDGYPQFIRTDGRTVVEGHPNQFLFKLTELGVPLSQTIDLGGGKTAPLGKVLEKAKLDTSPARIDPGKPLRSRWNNELGWTIGAFANTLPSGARWRNRYGEEVTLDGLIEVALQRLLGAGSCKGTHELYGLARALRSGAAHAPKLERYLKNAKEKAQAGQHADGSFGFFWHDPAKEEPRAPLKKNDKVWVTGHMLEWLVLASSHKELQEPWLRKAYTFLKEARFKSATMAPKGGGDEEVRYGVLAHAVHGMKLYEQALRDPKW